MSTMEPAISLVPTTPLVGNVNTPMIQPLSLYVGNLSPATTEADLYEFFNSKRPPTHEGVTPTPAYITSLRIPRDVNNGSSLGYAYLNFFNQEDAYWVLSNMNFELLQGQELRLSKCIRDPRIRKNPLGNVFVKNLPKTMNNKEFYRFIIENFPNYPLLSVKVSVDAKTNESNCYGFAHFADPAHATAAIEALNGQTLEIKDPEDETKVIATTTLVAVQFVPRATRLEASANAPFNNIYVRNLPESFSDDDLKATFSTIGAITSVYLTNAKDYRGTQSPKKFGFVCFANCEDAATALETMNEKEVAPGHAIQVFRPQKRAERIAQMTRDFAAQKRARNIATADRNLFVKNLDDSITTEILTNEFKRFGEIESCIVSINKETNLSNGYGFVCFKTALEAQNAIITMHSAILGTKPLFVCFAQLKEDRMRQMVNRQLFKHNQLIHTPGFPMQNVGYPAGRPAQMAGMPMQMMHPFPNYGYAFPGALPNQHFPTYIGSQHAAMPQHLMTSRGNFTQQQGGFASSQPRMPQHQRGAPHQGGRAQPGAPHQGGQHASGSNKPRSAMGANQTGNPRASSIARNQHGNTHQKNGSVPRSAPSENKEVPLTSEELNQVDQATRNDMLGKRLFPRVKAIAGDRAPKITGMLLQLDNFDLLTMLDDETCLKEAVEEALEVLIDSEAPSAQKGEEAQPAAAASAPAPVPAPEQEAAAATE